MPKTETVICDLCGQDKVRCLGNFTFQNTPLTLVECSDCGLIYVNPRLTFEQRNIYFQQYMEGTEKNAALWDQYREANFKVDLKLLKRIFGKEPGKLLDVGCGYGFFLREAEKCGWSGCGVEVSEPPARYAREKLGLDVHNCSLEEAGFPDKSFDAAVILDVIGYLQSPARTLSEIKRILKNDGILILRSLDRMTYLKAYNILLKMQGKSRPLDDNFFFEKDRNYQFSAKTLKKILRLKGFREIKVFNARLGNIPWRKPFIKGLMNSFMLFADFVWLVTAGKICLAPSITVVAKKGA